VFFKSKQPMPFRFPVRVALCALSLLPFALRPAFPQGNPFEGKRIVRIEYVPSPQPLDPRDLASAVAVKQGAPLHEADVARTIDQLFATGYYQDIQVDAEAAEGGVAVRFLTTLTWFTGHVSLSGKVHSPPNRQQILGLTPFTLGAPFDPASLDAARDNISSVLTQNGLFEHQVSLTTSKDPNTQQINVTIHLDTGKRARYQEPVIEGDTKLSNETIVHATGWKIRFIGRWRQVTQSLTTSGLQGIEKKYQSQDRLEASVALKSMKYIPKGRRAQPTLDIEAGPKITVKAMETKVSKRKLKKYVPIYQEGSVDQDLLVEGARNLRDYFQSKGYPDVDVTFRELPPEKDQQTIEYFISRGQSQKLEHIEIHGNNYFKTGTLRERMILQPASFQFRHGRYSEAFRHRDEESITDLYLANGFRDVKVTSTIEKNYNGKKNQLAATFNIDEGAQWIVSKLDISGLHRMNGDTLRGRLMSSSGQPYSTLNVASDRNAILTLYYRDGFPKAAFQWSATPAGPPHQVVLHYEITEGPQEFVRNVIVTGLRNTRRSLVDRDIPMHEGDPLSPVEISSSQQRLYNLGIFSSISTGIQNPDGTAEYKNVLYDFTEARRYTVDVGVGAEVARFGPTASNLSTPAGTTGFSPRLTLNVSRLNMFGIGHTATFSGIASNIRQRAGLSYIAPNLGDVPGRDLTVTGLYDFSRDIATFASRREEVSAQISERLSKPTTLRLQMSYRRVSTSDVVIPTLLVPQLLEPVRIGMFSANLVEDRRDDPSDPHGGIYNTVDVGISTKYLGSQRDFLRVLGRNATYTRIGSKLVLARQTQLGVIKPYNLPPGVTSADAIPLPERFYGGGDATNRGFAWNQAGPRDIGHPAGPGAPPTQPTGFPLGGNALLFNNVELRFPLFGDNIGGVVFEDAGNVYSTFSHISFNARQPSLQDFDYMVHAAGIGIRYNTPVGPIRVDLAYSINPPSFYGFKGNVQDLLACNPNLPPSQLPPQCTPVKQNTGHFQFFFSIGQTF
jgi:outer membrane protein assembly complex protein YaeT